LTDDRESLAAALEADDGERLTALEALGEDIALALKEEAAEHAPLRVPAKLPAVPFLKPEPPDESVCAPVPAAVEPAVIDPAALARARAAEGRFETRRASLESDDGARADAGSALHAGRDRPAPERRQRARAGDIAPEMAALAAMPGETNAGRVGACLEELRQGLEVRQYMLHGADARNPIDLPAYANWRRQLETAATAGRAILAKDGLLALLPGGGRDELEAMLGRADALLAGDDRVFGSRTAAGRARDWHDRWTEAVERTGGPDRAAELDRLAELGRAIADDPGLGDPDRGRVRTLLAGWEARGEAEAAGAAWLAAWNGGGGEDGEAERREEVLEEGRALAEDAAMPEALRQALLQALRADDEIEAERAEREARRGKAREAAAAARGEAADITFRLRTGSWSGDAETMDGRLASGDRLVRDRSLSPAGRERLEAVLDRERAYRADLLDRSVQAAEGGDKGLRALLARAEAAARDPKLAAEASARLDGAIDNARKRADAHRDFQKWRRDWNAFVRPIEAAKRPVFADRGCKPLVERARELKQNPHIGAAAKEVLELTVRRHDIERPAAVKRFGALLGKWEKIRAAAAREHVSRFAMLESAEIVEEMRTLAASPHLTQKQKQVFANIAAERDEHIAKRQQQQPQLVQRLGRGRSV
ncbi:MAG: hypothetical protein OXH14_18185, partial [Alphaproteobacteria bacterium]|nr:hypothetical protein [Alphaproteobacteria bacterium]